MFQMTTTPPMQQQQSIQSVPVMQAKPVAATGGLSRESKREEKQKRGKFKKIKSNDEIKTKLPETKGNHLIEKPPQSQPSVYQNSNLRKNVPPNTAIVTPNTSQISSKSCNINSNNSDLNAIVKSQLPPHAGINSNNTGATPKLVNAVPPLINMNPVPIPRVQTIQLTPQKQQALKNVQLQIQQLSTRLQNKSLLNTLTQEYDPTNPLHNKPLPLLANCNTDAEIHEALQILFIEQQKILATGKLIPNISAASFMTTPPSMSPIAPTSNSNGAFIGGSLQTIPSPVQINSPQVKQESGTPTSIVQNSSPSNSQTIVTSPQITGASIGHNLYTQRVMHHHQTGESINMLPAAAPMSPMLQDYKYPIMEQKSLPLPVPVPQPKLQSPAPASPKIRVPRPYL